MWSDVILVDWEVKRFVISSEQLTLWLFKEAGLELGQKFPEEKVKILSKISPVYSSTALEWNWLTNSILLYG